MRRTQFVTSEPRLWNRYARARAALTSKRRASSVDLLARVMSGSGEIPQKSVLRDSETERRMFIHNNNERIEFYDGKAIDHPTFTRVSSAGTDTIADRAYPRSRFTYTLHEVGVETRYGIPWNRNRDLLLSVHGGGLEKEAWEAWARDRSFRREVNSEDLIVIPSTPVFYHWLIDQLPGVLRAMSHSPNAQTVIASDAPKWMLRACEEMRIPVVQVRGKVVHANRYTSVTREPGNPIPCDIQLLRSRAGIGSVNLMGGERLVISRRQASRYTRMELCLEEELAKRGFRVVVPENLTLTEQIQAFSSAEIVIGASGSAMSNLIWCPENVKVVVLKHANLSPDFIWNRVGPRSASFWQVITQSLSANDVLSIVLDLVEQ